MRKITISILVIVILFTLTINSSMAQGDGQRARAMELRDLGVQAANQGRYEEALIYFEQALVIVREIGDREFEGSILSTIGFVYDMQGQYEQTLDYYQQALTIHREVGDRMGEGQMLNYIGMVYHTQRQYEQAIDYYQQALAIQREMGDRESEGQTLIYIGAVYYRQGQYEQALDVSQQALAISHELGNRANEGQILHNIGELFRVHAQYKQALDYYHQALSIQREVGNYTMEGQILHDIGGVYHSQGQYGLALDYYQQALAIRHRERDRMGEVNTLNSFALVYDAQGQYRQALDYYQQALAIAREIGGRSAEGTIFGNIGLLYYHQKQYKQALGYYEQALVIAREMSDRVGEAATLHNMGGVYSAQEQYGLALDYYQQALVIAREMSDRAGEGQTLSNIGGVYHSQGQYGLALDYYQQALNIHREVSDLASEGQTLSNIGATYDNQGQVAQAIDYYQQSVDVQESLLRVAALDQSIIRMEGSNINLNLKSRLPILLIQEGDLLSALEYAERGRGILARSELRGGVIDFRSNLDDQSLLDEEENLRLAVIETQNLVNALNEDLSASNADIQNAENALDDTRSAYDHHLERMQLQGGFLARELVLDVASLAEIQSALPDDTTLLLYGLGDDGGYALLITANDLRGFILDAASEEIETLIRTFAADRRANATTLQNLYTLLFAPIVDEIATTNLIISPDGSLNYVPFAALQASDGSYLIDHYTISMIPSGTALVLLSEREPSGPANFPGLVLAQPSAPGLRPLQHAQSEAETIAEQLGVTPIIVATESDLRNGSIGAAIIHISAHAELDRFAPLFSVIYLGGDDIYDGRFEVREIYELDLTQGTELVVLSGCETASGGTGEDFGLLSRAFFAAGAPRVVASLWSVDDTATADLLTTFIAERANYDTDAAALRAAMLATREKYPEPYYWASFVLNGLS